MNANFLSVFKNIRNILVVLAGNALYALAVVTFILPGGIITGGTTGLALAADRFLHIPVTAFVFSFNLVMFAAGALILGKKFALTTLVSTFFYPAALAFWQRFPILSHVTGDHMLCTVFGGLMIGAGIGIVIRVGASTGGMDIPPLILNKKFGLPVSVLLYGFDFLILLLQMTFSDPEQSLYGILLVAVYTLVLDKVLVAGSARTQVKVVSPRYEEIREGILRELDRGCTLLSAETGFLGNRWPMVVTVVSGRELHRLTRRGQELDPGAFLVGSRGSEVRGRGFSLGKVHRSREKGEGAD